jgi:hypothetical protein
MCHSHRPAKLEHLHRFVCKAIGRLAGVAIPGVIGGGC